VSVEQVAILAKCGRDLERVQALTVKEIVEQGIPISSKAFPSASTLPFSIVV